MRNSVLKDQTYNKPGLVSLIIIHVRFFIENQTITFQDQFTDQTEDSNADTIDRRIGVCGPIGCEFIGWEGL
jgi:hypothetical protein